MTINEVIQYLETASKSDLIKLKGIIDLKLNSACGIDPDIYFFILNELGEKPIALDKFSKSQSGSEWKKGQVQFDAIFNELIEGQDYKRVHIIALKKFLASILLDYLRDQKRQINMKFICEGLASFNKVFDGAFPGYRKNQLGPLIWSKLMDKNSG